MEYKKMFIIDNTLNKSITTVNQNNEIVIFEQYNGYIIKENEDTCRICFKDINKDLQDMDRYYIVQSNEIPAIKKQYELYSDQEEKVYNHMLELKHNVTNDGKPEGVYNRNKAFFISQNISKKEWESFCM